MNDTPTPVTTWYLEMRDPAQLRAARIPQPEPLILRAELPLPTLNRFLYTAVGGPWYWRDRLGWSYARWMTWLDRPELQTWVLYHRGTPAGYIELERQPAADTAPAKQRGQEAPGRAASASTLSPSASMMPPSDDVEIAYFGVMREFLGQGLGGHLLTVGIERAWAMGARRVWVHTCTLDGPHALANYEARGMVRYHQETRTVALPAQPDGPWPGWDNANGG